MNPAIIIVGYKRHKSLSRLLDSITKATFPHPVSLVISLDGGYNIETLKVAEKFKSIFSEGTVEVIARTENLGLREHIIWCGDQSKKFGSVIILEDDLIVDPQFYNYASHAASYYSTDKSIAGISLYAQEFNEYAQLPFRPLHNGTSCYFMQVASSWGQLWTSDQWEGFKSWYLKNKETHLTSIRNLPAQIKNWPSSSWKKFYNGYLVEKKLFFAYPYQSYTTNVSDGGGTHIIDGTLLLQTQFYLSERSDDTLFFCEKESAIAVHYDPYMEPSSKFLYELLGYKIDQLTFDAYGLKPLTLLRDYKYTITSKKTKSALKDFPLSFRPFEQSILHSDGGGSAHLFLTETRLIESEDQEQIVEITEYLAGVSLNGAKLARALLYSWIKNLPFRLAKKFLPKKTLLGKSI